MVLQLKVSNEAKVDNYFSSPIWLFDKPEWVKSVNKACDKYIKEAYKRDKDKIKKDDFGWSYHSGTIFNDPKLKELHDWVGATSHNFLDSMGYDLSNHTLYYTESWVQEFSKKGGGHHTLHTHWNGHISGFYFLKADESTSLPMFEDPRPGNVMNLLPEKDKTKVTYASSQINYQVKPGRLMFFPSYMPHQYVVDMGYEPFRFIHWNCQAISKNVLDAK